MKKSTVLLIICPNCNSEELEIEPYRHVNDEIHEGRLICSMCKVWYRIENCILDLLPLNLRRIDLYKKFANEHKLNLKISEEKTVNQEVAHNQIKFFRKNLDNYEKQVVNSKYYRALDSITFLSWINNRLKPGDFALDLGCGTGRQCIPLAQHGIKSIGLDISEEMLLLAMRKISSLGLSKYVDLIVGDAEKPPFKNHSFNVCILYGILHHLNNKNIAIANASNKLAKNGLFYSLDPHNSPSRFLFDFMMKIWKLYDEDAGVNHLLSERELCKWLFDAGIKNTVKYSTFFPPHLLYLLSVGVNIKLLKLSDSIFNKIPLIRIFGGVIVVEGIKVENQ